MSFIETLFLAFIPLFVAIDVFGVLPMFLSLTNGVSVIKKKKLITQATLTAVGISMLFLFAGKALFSFLGISEADFRIAGGILLLVLAIRDMVSSQTAVERDSSPQGDAYDDTVGVVPIGIPLTMGPAALTSLLISAEAHGVLVTFFALVLNLFIVWAVFRKSDLVLKFIGPSGSRAIAKVMALFLAAIGVMMIRMGYKDLFFAG